MIWTPQHQLDFGALAVGRSLIFQIKPLQSLALAPRLRMGSALLTN
jgi:hypothetical protein